MGEVEEDVEAVEHAVRENDFGFFPNGASQRLCWDGRERGCRWLEIGGNLDDLYGRLLGRCHRLRAKWNVMEIGILCALGHESNAAKAVAVEHARVALEGEDTGRIDLDGGLLAENSDCLVSAGPASLRDIHRLVIDPFEAKWMVLDFEDLVVEEEFVDLEADLPRQEGKEWGGLHCPGRLGEKTDSGCLRPVVS